MIYANGFAQQDKDYFHSVSERSEAVRRLSVNNLTMVENVIKQGYLKRGSSYENRFSGLIDKIIPRKWYMLVVRGRVPFLEQFDRDVDVFSGPPSVSYNLSNCTAVSHCMAQTPRAFTFVISCADRLIELTAASREQMIDWCDVLERTLNSLGILKKEKEEHIYTFCPAVVFSGRSKKEEESENEETLGAVGGTPVSPPPRHPPPLPSGHPSALPRPGPEKAPASPLKEPTPPPLPSSLPPPLRRSQSPTSLQPPTEQAPLPPGSKTHQLLSPPCHSVSSPPLFPPLYESPPLPPARHHIPSLSVSTPPPPLPPARHHIEEKHMESALCGTEVNPPRQHKFHLEVLSQENGDSDQESADYSSDFVSEAFWEINRRIPVPTARHSVLSGKPKSNSSASATDVEELGEGDISNETECQSSGQAQEELDEGYSGLALVKMLKKSKKDVQHPAQSASSVQMNSVQKLGSHDGVGSENSSSTCMPVSEERCSGTDCESGVSQSFDNQVGNVTCSNDVVAEFSVREADPNAPQNFYSAFPVRETSHQVMTVENGFGDADETTEKHILVEEPVQNSEFSLFQQENPYDVVFKASSVISSSDVPPLPPRHDSLLKRNIENASPNMVCGDTSSGSANSSSSSDETEVFVHKPAPVPPKTFQHVSSAPSDLNSHGVSRKTPEMPPLLPPRRGSRFNRGLSVDTAELSPPPLPARKAQSVRVQRPRTAPPHSSSSACADKASSLWYPGCEETSNQVVEQNPPSKRPQQNQRVRKEPTAAENNLRHRMRLDRAHSVHSVISLKQSQAEILRQEMELSGVSVTVNLRAALHIAFVDCVGLVCIAGWNQNDFPSLHGKFHIGDQVLSIQNVKVTSVAMAVKLIKQQTSDVIEVLVERLPYGQVFAIRRSAEGESLGIRRMGGTAEIEYVDPHGLAASNGLPLRPSGVLSDKRTTWTLTEINSRHLSLFFKDLEIEHRLNAVGREITIVVQPSDYMCELKKQLKKMKNYKSFIVQ